MDAVLLVNERCGALAQAGGTISPDQLRDVFRAHGARVDVRLVPPAGLEQAVRSVAAEARDALLVGGGDGTISTAARCLAGTGMPIGVLPLGTLNHFAKDLGLPADWREAAATLARGRVRVVDAGEVNGRLFINNCSLGAYPDAVLRRDAIRRRGRGKWFAMTVATMTEFRRLRRIRFRLQTSSGIVQLRSPFLLISNNQYTGRVLSQRLRPKMDEGRLWIYTTRAKGHFRILRMVWQSLVHRLDDAEALEIYSVEEAHLSTEFTRLPVGVDGEVVDVHAPLHVRARPAALRVLA